MSTDDRSRNWCFILYPDSAPAEWDLILRESMVAGCYSPLHAPADSKPHIHCILSFTSKKSKSQVQAITQSLNATQPFVVHDLRQMTRYLIHADNPDKEQFQPSDIVSFGGFVADKYFSLSSFDKQDLFKELMQFIRDNPDICYCDLVDICLDTNPDWLYLLQTNLAVNKVITEYLYSRSKKIEKIIENRKINC